MNLGSIFESPFSVFEQLQERAVTVAALMTPIRAAAIAQAITPIPPTPTEFKIKLFDDFKHALRSDVHGEIDVLWQMHALRQPLRDLASEVVDAIERSPAPASTSTPAKPK